MAFRRIVRWTFRLAVLAVIVVAAAVISGLAAPLPSATLSVNQVGVVAEATDFSLPTSGASALGFADGTTLFASNDASEKVAIGSIAKVITALVVLNAKAITDTANSPTLTMTQTDVQFYNSYDAADGSVTEVLQGLQLSEYQVLQLMLLPSANNYAATAANWAFGSTSAFLTAAQSWLATNGLSDTTITDPAGLDSGTVSTASDLIKLGRLAMANSVVAGIVSQKTASIPTIGTVANTNEALGSNDIVGIKTGTTISAGHCLLFAVDADTSSTNTPVIGVILGEQNSDDLYAAVEKTAAAVVSSYHAVTAAASGATAATLTTQWGSSTNLTYSETVSLTTVGKTTVTVDVSHPEVSSLTKGETDGTATITVTDLHGTQTFTQSLSADQSLTTAPISWQLNHALRWIPSDVLPFIGWR